MRVEAVKKKDGLLIPMTEAFREIKKNRILLEVEIVKPVQPDDYSVLDQIVGLCETKHANASIDHDAIIYGRKDTNDLR